MRAPLLFLILSAWLLGCGSRGFRDYNQLGNLRILSLKADLPEADPGAAVVITPLVSDYSGLGRALTYSVETCSDAAAAALTQRRPDCVGASDRAVVTTDAALTGLSAPNYTGSAPTISITLPTTLLDGLSPAFQFNGVKFRVVYTVTASDGTQEVGVKALIASNRPTKNSNPSLTAIFADDAALSSLPTSEVTLTPQLSSGSTESYTALSSSSTLITSTETLTTSWFISHGSADGFRTTATESSKWTPPTSAPSGQNTLVIGVTRDGRGGESFVISTL